MTLIKSGNKEEIEKGSRKWVKVPRGGPSISNRGNEANSTRDILRSMLEVSRVFRGRLLLEYVMVVE
ncbi:hypothetical protein CK203_102323 [Vitis vinifera]|uniref:Uncharacterized protein n=1 Tax=Vitis vinifera TaxID=29760 RepID=A0A438BR29_VITVI|nr:hypothetical protein CK203_102323 [Vitis vinifera]